jgi:hypothetical protein
MIRRRITIHFGAHKTGSSSIQNSLLNLDNSQWSMIKSTKSANESLQLDSAFRLKQSPRLIARKNEGKLTDPTAIKALYSQHIADSSAS